MGLRGPGHRSDETNPLSGRCKLALRRICGVCQHFEGTDIRATGRCAFLGYAGLSGRSDAARCDHWGRRTVAPGAVSQMVAPAGPVAPVAAPRARRQADAVPLAERLKQYPVLARQGLTIAQAVARLGVGRATIGRDLWARGLSWSALRDVDEPEPVATLDQVFRAVVAEFAVSRDDLIGPIRTRDVAEARAVLFALAMDLAGLSATATGRQCGGRHANTVGPVARRARDAGGARLERARKLVLSGSRKDAA